MTTTSEIRTALRKLNIALAKMVRNTYFDGIPVGEISNLVEQHGFNPEGLEGIYCGRDGRSSASLGFGKFIHMTWHKMEATGRYEIVAYAN